MNESIDLVVRYLLHDAATRDSSVRLLRDLVKIGTEHIELDPNDVRAIRPATRLVVLEGAVQVGAPQGRTGGKRRKRLRHGRVHARLREAAESVKSHPRTRSVVAVLPDEAIDRARQVSFALDRTLAEGARLRHRAHVVRFSSPVLPAAAVEAIAELTGAAVAERWGEAVLLLAPRGGDWTGRHRDAGQPEFTDVVGAELETLLEKLTARPEKHELPPPVHVFVADSGPTPARPELAALRIVEIRADLPEAMPRRFEPLLPDDATDATGQPLYASYVVFRLRGEAAPDFRTRRIEEPEPAGDAAFRIFRDHVPLGVTAAEAAALRPGTAAPTALRRRSSAWAASLTNRAIGFALGGGGASCFRLARVLEELGRPAGEGAVAPDLVLGVSGGALLGAYYCADRESGLDLLVDGSWRLAPAGLLSSLSASVLAKLVGFDLYGRTSDDVECRFATLAVELAAGLAPDDVFVDAGPLGLMVEASSSVPLATHAVIGDNAYFDGATGTSSPARALWDMGADLVVGLNAVPSPDRSDPLGGSGIVQKLLHWTPLGRIVDGLTVHALTLQRLNQGSKEDSHVLYDPDPRNLPFFEMFFWWDAPAIRRRAVREPTFAKQVAEIRRVCLAFGRYQ